MFRPLIDEDWTGNPLHLLSILVTCVWTGLTALRRREDCLVLVYMAAVIGGYAVFCAVLKLAALEHAPRPTIVHSGRPGHRIGVVRDSITNRNSISLLLFLLAAVVLLRNPGHPLAFKRNVLISIDNLNISFPK